MSQFLLACDVGNSRTKFGLFRREDINASALPSCIVMHAVPHGEPIDWTPFREYCAEAQTNVAGIIAGANPEQVIATQTEWPREWADEPIVVDRPESLPIDVRIEQPSKIGIDRLLNAIAANVVRPSRTPAIIVDSGTATTIDAVDATGGFRGGAILPGFELSAKALNHYTALLPLVDIMELTPDGPHALGQNTRAALQSGLFWGQLGAARELIARLTRDASLSENGDPIVLLTGGGGPLLHSHLPRSQWNPHLSLQGLVCVANSLGGETH